MHHAGSTFIGAPGSVGGRPSRRDAAGRTAYARSGRLLPTPGCDRTPGIARRRRGGVCGDHQRPDSRCRQECRVAGQLGWHGCPRHDPGRGRQPAEIQPRWPLSGLLVVAPARCHAPGMAAGPARRGGASAHPWQRRSFELRVVSRRQAGPAGGGNIERRRRAPAQARRGRRLSLQERTSTCG